jgi:HSP20 family protein
MKAGGLIMPIAPYRASTDVFRPIFDEIFGTPTDGNRIGNLMRAPLADVREVENEIQVIIEMPGIRPEDLNVDIENNVLTISGEKRQESREGDERGTWHLSERRYGHFSRSFVLPRDVDAEGIRAGFEHGVLSVSIPKSEKARRRRIEVRHGTGQQNIEAHSS